MPNPDDMQPAPPPEWLETVRTAFAAPPEANPTQAQIDALAATTEEAPPEEEDEEPVREVSPEELAQRMRDIGLNPDHTPGQTLASPIFADPAVEAPAQTEESEILRQQAIIHEAMIAAAQPQEATTTDDMIDGPTDYRDFRVRQDDRFPHPEQGEIVMTRAQLGRTRRLEIRTKRFKVTSITAGEPRVSKWWAAFGLGHVETKAEAQEFSWDEIMQLGTGMTDTFIYCKYDDGLSANPAPAEPVKEEPKKEKKKERTRRCNWQDALGNTMVNMISLAPKNNTFRAKIMAMLKEPVPEEMDTAQKIKDWIEFEFPRRKGESTNRTGVPFHINYNQIESGTVSFRRVINGEFRGVMTREEVVEFARSHSTMTWDQLIVAFRNEMERRAREGGVVTPGTPDLRDFEITETTGFEATLLTSIRSLIRDVLRNNLTVDEIEDLGI